MCRCGWTYHSIARCSAKGQGRGSTGEADSRGAGETQGRTGYRTDRMRSENRWSGHRAPNGVRRVRTMSRRSARASRGLTLRRFRNSRPHPQPPCTNNPAPRLLRRRFLGRGQPRQLEYSQHVSIDIEPAIVAHQRTSRASGCSPQDCLLRIHRPLPPRLVRKKLP